MTYQQFGRIEATDFNTLASTFNSIYSAGTGNSGYGQTSLSAVSQFATVQFGDWANLINTTKTVASHQGTAITNIFAPQQGDRIDYIGSVQTNLTSITTNRLNAAAQGTTSSTATSVSTSWASAITFTQSVTFSSANQARYFFNAGGQIALTFAHPTGTGVNSLLNTLASRCGTIVLSAGSCTIAGTAYTGTTKIGGSGTPTVLSTGTGFYNLLTTDTEIFRQVATGLTPSAYAGSLIQVFVKINALPGTGTIVTFTTVWDEIPNGGTTLVASAGTATTLTIRPPSTSYLSNSWGTPTVLGSVTGS